MNIILLALIIFLEMLHYMIIADVVLSWLVLFGLNIRPKFLMQIVTPIYIFIQKYIPTRIGMFDFTPIIALLGLLFIIGLIHMSFPEVRIMLDSLTTQ